MRCPIEIVSRRWTPKSRAFGTPPLDCSGSPWEHPGHWFVVCSSRGHGSARRSLGNRSAGKFPKDAWADMLQRVAGVGRQDGADAVQAAYAMF
jgi:hypothetical protein